MSDKPTNDDAMAGPSHLEQISRFEVVKLSRPIRARGEDVGELRIREPAMLDLERIPSEAYDRAPLILRHVLSQCTGVPGSSIQQLSVTDAMACSEALARLGFTSSDLYRLVDSGLLSSLEAGTTGSD